MHYIIPIVILLLTACNRQHKKPQYSVAPIDEYADMPLAEAHTEAVRARERCHSDASLDDCVLEDRLKRLLAMREAQEDGEKPKIALAKQEAEARRAMAEAESKRAAEEEAQRIEATKAEEAAKAKLLEAEKIAKAEARMVEEARLATLRAKCTKIKIRGTFEDKAIRAAKRRFGDEGAFKHIEDFLHGGEWGLAECSQENEFQRFYCKENRKASHKVFKTSYRLIIQDTVTDEYNFQKLSFLVRMGNSGWLYSPEQFPFDNMPEDIRIKWNGMANKWVPLANLSRAEAVRDAGGVVLVSLIKGRGFSRKNRPEVLLEAHIRKQFARAARRAEDPFERRLARALAKRRRVWAWNFIREGSQAYSPIDGTLLFSSPRSVTMDMDTAVECSQVLEPGHRKQVFMLREQLGRLRASSSL